jgi:sugar lactone lactonase YvrE
MRNLSSSLFSRVLASTLLVAGAFAGCASDGSSGKGGDDDDTPPQDDGELPFTNGVSTLAGMADAGYVDGARKVAQFSNPVNVLYRDGTLYVADFDNGKLRAIDTESHVTTTIINQPSFKRPFGMAFAADGTLYVSTDNDSAGNHTPMSGSIWRVDVDAKTATVVANAIGRPRGLAVLPDGRLAVADYLHHVVEVVDPATGKATTIAGAWDGAGMIDGAGTAAKFSAPYNIVVKADGTLLVSDFDNNRIRSVTMAGATSTVAGAGTGFADGSMASAQFSHPQAMAMADNGDIYVSDLGNFRVRRISGTTVETIAGDGQMGYIDNDNPLASEIYGLEGLSVVPDGSMVYVADGNRGEAVPYNRVRQIKLK